MGNNHQGEYRSIVKTTSLFGGVQAVQILTSILRGKLVAVILGAVGMGINALFTSAINLLTMVSTFGLNFSAVRDISQATESNDPERLSRTLHTFSRWIIFCALLGSVIAVAAAPWISELSFDDRSYTMQVRLVSAAVFFTILSNSKTTILQGTRQYKALAKASLIGSIAGLVTSVPIYLAWGDAGIVPALIIGAGTLFAVNWFYASKVQSDPVKQTLRETFFQGKEMAKLGVVLMISSFLSMLVIYLVNSYVGRYGSLADVGFYGAGTSITNQYLGLVFTAMSVDYFPRLSAVSHDQVKVNHMVNQQAEIVVLICAPLIVGMMLTAPLLIRVLLSPEFLVIREFICILALGMIFKAASYAVGYISFAKGDKKLFFWLEGIYGNASTLGFNVLGYYLWGLTGMAISFAISFALYFVLILVVTRIRYQFHLDPSFLRIFATMLVLTSAVFVQTLLFTSVWGYMVGGAILVGTIWYSFQKLDKGMDIKGLIKRKFK
ncbi:O-antigen translocase [uncultured Rikenella sp.]|uniref:O-antigen translocase n=1 Tax=uncultured Rikenella sp. TaxID=368003 RepID=UPI002630DF09|nr:O-antigen translocase [uncultured Rikenella sp.]